MPDDRLGRHATATPTRWTYVIPGNDDAIRAVDLIAGVIADAAREGPRIGRAKASKGDGRRYEPEASSRRVAEASPDFEQEPLAAGGDVGPG